MSAVSPQLPAPKGRLVGRMVGGAGAWVAAFLLSVMLSACGGGGGFGSVDGSGPAATVDNGEISTRKVAETVSRMDWGVGAEISPENVQVSTDPAILDKNPFSPSSGGPSARTLSGRTANPADSEPFGYKAFEVSVPADNPIMTVAVWISETPPAGAETPDPQSSGEFVWVRLQVHIAAENIPRAGEGFRTLETTYPVEVRQPSVEPEVVKPLCLGELRVAENGESHIRVKEGISPGDVRLSRTLYDLTLFLESSGGSGEECEVSPGSNGVSCESRSDGACLVDMANFYAGASRSSLVRVEFVGTTWGMADLLDAPWRGTPLRDRLRGYIHKRDVFDADLGGDDYLFGRGGGDAYYLGEDTDIDFINESVSNSGYADDVDEIVVENVSDVASAVRLRRGHQPGGQTYKRFNGHNLIVELVPVGGGEVVDSLVVRKYYSKEAAKVELLKFEWDGSVHDLSALVDDLKEGEVMEAPLRAGAKFSKVARVPAVVATVVATVRVEDSSSPLVLSGEVAGESTVVVSVGGPVSLGVGGGYATLETTEYYLRRVTVIPTTLIVLTTRSTVETDGEARSEMELVASRTVTSQSPPGVVVEAEARWTFYEVAAPQPVGPEVVKPLCLGELWVEENGESRIRVKSEISPDNVRLTRSNRLDLMLSSASSGGSGEECEVDSDNEVSCESHGDNACLVKVDNFYIVSTRTKRNALARVEFAGAPGTAWDEADILEAAWHGTSRRERMVGDRRMRDVFDADAGGNDYLYGGGGGDGYRLGKGADLDQIRERYFNTSYADDEDEIVVEKDASDVASAVRLRRDGRHLHVELIPTGGGEVANALKVVDYYHREAAKVESLKFERDGSVYDLSALVGDLRDGYAMKAPLRAGARFSKVCADVEEESLDSALLEFVKGGIGEDPDSLADVLNGISDMLDCGADVDAKDASGSTSLQIAAEHNLIEVAALLLTNGADVDVKAADEGTPLHFASANGFAEMARLLLLNGAEVNARKEDPGPSSRDLAAGNEHEAAALLLRDFGGVCYLESGALCADVSAVVATVTVTVRVEDWSSPLVLSGEVAGESTVVVSVDAPVLLGVGGGYATVESTEYYLRRLTVIPTTLVVLTTRSRVETDGEERTEMELIASRTVTSQAPPGVVVEAEARWTFYRRPVTADSECPAGTLPADGWTQEELDEALHDKTLHETRDLSRLCDLLRRGADVNASYKQGRSLLAPKIYEHRWTPLHRAVWNGWLAGAALLLANGADVNATGRVHQTPLHLAARNDYREVAVLLLANGADVDAKGDSWTLWWTPLHWAASHGSPEVAVLLLENGADVNARSTDSRRPLHMVVNRDLPEFAALLLANGADVNARDNDGETPLHLAARNDYREVAALLLANGARGNAISNQYQHWHTPLHIAAHEDSLEVAALLLASGVDVDARSKGDYTPLHWAAGRNFREFVALLLENGADVNAKGKDVNVKGKKGETPLHWAAKNNSLETAALLLENGADVDAKDHNIWTPLHDAARYDSPEVAALLLANGADVAAKSEYGATPLYLAAERSYRKGYREVVALLLENGANASAKSERRGDTPLHRAATHRSLDIAALLLANGADVNAKDNDSGRTPLHIVGRGRDSPEVAALLLANGADVNAKDNDGWTPLHVAARLDSPEVAALLLANGADVHAVDNRGRTPLDVAQERQSHLRGEVIAILEAAKNPPAPAEPDLVAEALRESFANSFNPSPAFGDAFGAAESGGGFLNRLDSLMHSTSSGGNEWDSFSGWQSENDYGRFWFSTGHRGDFGFGAGGNGAAGVLDANPFAALVGNGMLAGGETSIGNGKLRVAAFGDYRAQSFLEGDDRKWTNWAASGTAIEAAMSAAESFSGLSENRNRGAMTEIHLGDSDLGFALQAGALSESDSVLSATGERGGSDLRGLRSRTAFAGVSGSADVLGTGWRLRGSAHMGRSWAESGGLLRAADLWASSFSAGLERGDWLYAGDGFVLRLSQPLRVEDWEMELVGEDGSRRLGAGPSGRQLDVDAAYRLPLSGGGWLLLSAGVRREGGHSSSSGTEAGALFSVEREF